MLVTVTGLRNLDFTIDTAQKIKFSIKETPDLVTFTEEILNGKLHFWCSVRV